MRIRVLLFAVIPLVVTVVQAQSGAPASTGRNFVSPTGVKMKVVLDDKDLHGTEVEIVELTFPPNSDSGDHRHAVTETFYLLEGELDQVVNGTPVKLTPGKSVSVRSTDQVRHKSGPNGAKVLVVWAPGGEIARVTARWKPE